jgi:hypothetical protein
MENARVSYSQGVQNLFIQYLIQHLLSIFIITNWALFPRF